MPHKEPETGGPSIDVPATSATTPQPATSEFPTAPPRTHLPNSETTQSSGEKGIADKFEPETGGPSGDVPTTSATTPPQAASESPTTPPRTHLPNSETTQSSGEKGIADKFEHETGGPSGDVPTTSATTPPPAASESPTTPPRIHLPNSETTQSSGDKDIAEKLILMMEEQEKKLVTLKFGSPVKYIYHPVVYAKETHDCFIRKYGNSPRSVLFLGMNPGQNDTAQNGVPFGETNYVKDWMKITGNVGQPPKQHRKRIIDGLECKGKAPSAHRFWTLVQELCDTPENFFKECFVYDYCPLLFLDDKGKEFTPQSMKVDMRNPLTKVCDEFLYKMIQLLEVEVVVGIGRFAEERTKKVLKKAGLEAKVRVVYMKHPSPKNPFNNCAREWQKSAKKTLKDNDLMKYIEVNNK